MRTTTTNESEGSPPCLSLTACGTTHRILRCKTCSTLFFFGSFHFVAAVSIWTTFALHLVLLQQNDDIPLLVAALPPGPGSFDFSPACFGTFHTDLLRACVLSDVSALFYLSSCPRPLFVIFLGQRLVLSSLRVDFRPFTSWFLCCPRRAMKLCSFLPVFLSLTRLSLINSAVMCSTKPILSTF